jgi:hypothetical protein
MTLACITTNSEHKGDQDDEVNTDQPRHAQDSVTNETRRTSTKAAAGDLAA